MLLFTALWYRYEAQLQQRAHITQLLSALQVSIRPFIENGNYDQLNTHFERARFSSPLEIHAVVLFNQAHQPLVASGQLEALKDFAPITTANTLTIQQLGQQQLALQPLASLPLSLSADNRLSGMTDKYYLAILVSPKIATSVWLLPVAIVALLGFVMLVMLFNTVRRAAFRQYTDISLLVHKLHQLRQGQQHSRINEDLVPELLTLKEAINKFADHQFQLTEQLNTELGVSRQQLAELQQQFSSVKREHTTLSRQHYHDKETLRHWLLNMQSLSQQADQMPMPEFVRQLHSLLSLMLFKQQAELLPDAPKPLPEWLSAQVALWSEDENTSVELCILEAPETVNQQLIAPLNAVNALIKALINISKEASQVTELTVRSSLTKHAESAELHISVTSNGQGLSRHNRALLQSTNIDRLQWQDSNAGLVMLLAEKLRATLDIQSLEGLGTTLTIHLPVSVETFSPPLLANLLVVDVNTPRLSERKMSFSAVALNTLFCTSLDELKLKYKQFDFDVVVVFLPDPKDLTSWQSALQHIAESSRILCCSSVTAAPIWQEALMIPVQDKPFCLADLNQHVTDATQPSAASLPRLLVVDDNPTNLAFITVLMKEQPLQLVTVMSGTEALRICAEQQFDIILLDIQLPDINGTDVAIRLRQMPAYKNIPILAFTAHALKHEVELFLQSGMDDVIFKPLEIDKLQTILSWCSVKQKHVG